MTNPAIQDGQVKKKCIDYAQLNDNGLLILVGESRDRDALAELYDRYKITVRRFLKRKMYQPKLFEEVYNDVMLTVWQKANSFKGASKVSTWIFGIAYRIRLAHDRKESLHRHNESDTFMVNIELENEVTREHQNSVSETVSAALVNLSEQHRSVIELAYFHGYSTQEIADIVGCPKNTVKTRLFHARKKLRAILNADQSEKAVNYPYRSNALQQNNSLSPEWAF